MPYFVPLKPHSPGFFLTSSHLPCSTFQCCNSLELSSGFSVLHILQSGNLIQSHGFKYYLYLLTTKYISPCQASPTSMLHMYMCIWLLIPCKCLLDISNSALFTNFLFSSKLSQPLNLSFPGYSVNSIIN